jgi:hypothetical protein
MATVVWVSRPATPSRRVAGNFVAHADALLVCLREIGVVENASQAVVSNRSILQPSERQICERAVLDTEGIAGSVTAKRVSTP